MSVGAVSVGGGSAHYKNMQAIKRTTRETTVLCYSVFFFSSRRRHTRLQGDWSSDVCSSDLLVHGSNPFKRLIPAIRCDLLRCSACGRVLDLHSSGPQTTSALELSHYRAPGRRSEEHTSELQSPCNLVCRLLLEKKKTSTTAS